MDSQTQVWSLCAFRDIYRPHEALFALFVGDAPVTRVASNQFDVFSGLWGTDRFAVKSRRRYSCPWPGIPFGGGC